jgi:acetylornithine deacetylase
MAHHQLDSTTGLLNRLIGFPTISTDSNIDLIQFAADRLDALGAEVHVSLDGTGQKANMFATLGPKRDGGIVLSGHSDVVPVENQDWTSDPFVMQERDGKLYGRGTCDMKGFIAASLAMAEDYAGLDLARPVHFCFTHDEETGCLGARALMEELKHIGMKPSACIIGEPTLMRIIEGHKGCYEYTTEFSGLAGHGSVPDAGVSAVEYAVRYVSRLMSLRPELEARCPEGSPFEPPHTTLQIGRVNGGIAHNVIADTCVVDWEMRPVQSSDAAFVKDNMRAYVEDELLPAMRAVHPTPASSPTSSARWSAWNRCRTARHSSWCLNSPVPTPRTWCASVPRQACSRKSASRRWCAAPAPSSRPTSRTSMSRSTSSTSAWTCWRS